MAITAFTSTAIIDATTIGTTVLTASTEGIAADAIGLGATDNVTFNSIDVVDGDFSGDVKAAYVISSSSAYADPVKIRLDGIKGYLYGYNTIVALDWNHASVKLHRDIYPVLDAWASSGIAANRWSNTYSVDGSFSGSLVSEVGGALKLYNLGTESDADTEYLETSWDTNECIIRPKSTGSGANRNFNIQSSLGSAYSNIQLGKFGTLGMRYSGTNNLLIGNGYVQAGADIWPTNDNAVECGRTTKRWSSVASVDGDFSGNVTMSGLPTSDPAVAGQLYTTTGGALKVSAG